MNGFSAALLGLVLAGLAAGGEASSLVLASGSKDGNGRTRSLLHSPPECLVVAYLSRHLVEPGPELCSHAPMFQDLSDLAARVTNRIARFRGRVRSDSRIHLQEQGLCVLE